MTHLSAASSWRVALTSRRTPTAIPGLSTLSTLVGSLMAFGLVLSLAGFVGCAIVMAIGHHSANPQWSTKGKMGCCCVPAAALLMASGPIDQHVLQPRIESQLMGAWRSFA